MPVARPMTKEEVKEQINKFVDALRETLLNRLEKKDAFLMLTEPRLFSGDIELSEVLKGMIDLSTLHSAQTMNHERVDEPFTLESSEKYFKKVNEEWRQQVNAIHNIICYQMVKRHELGEKERLAWRAKAQQDVLDAASKKATEDIKAQEDKAAGLDKEAPLKHGETRAYNFSFKMDEKTGIKESKWTPMTPDEAKKLKEKIRIEDGAKAATWTRENKPPKVKKLTPNGKKAVQKVKPKASVRRPENEKQVGKVTQTIKGKKVIVGTAVPGKKAKK